MPATNRQCSTLNQLLSTSERLPTITANEIVEPVNGWGDKVVLLGDEIKIMARGVVFDWPQQNAVLVQQREIWHDGDADTVRDEAGDGVVFLDFIQNIGFDPAAGDDFIN